MDGSQWVDPLAACVTYQLKKKKEAWMEVCIKICLAHAILLNTN